eukprot:7702906-Prorocentrum_lima.AAC.1
MELQSLSRGSADAAQCVNQCLKQVRAKGLGGLQLRVIDHASAAGIVKMAQNVADTVQAQASATRLAAWKRNCERSPHLLHAEHRVGCKH